MEARAILKKLALYLVFFVASVIFTYFMTSIGLFFFSEGAFPVEEEPLFGKIVMPIMYAAVALGVSLVVEFGVLGTPSEPTERKIFAWGLVVVFLFHLAVLAVVLIVGSTFIKPEHPDFSFLAVPLVPPLVFVLGQLAYGISMLVSLMRTHKEENGPNLAEKANVIDGKRGDCV